MKTPTTPLPSVLLLGILLLSVLVMACGQRGGVPQSVQPIAQAQTSIDSTYDPQANHTIFTVTEQPPSFPQLDKYLRQNVRYPEAARLKGVQGVVFLSFIVTKAGNLREVRVLKGLGFGADEEALRLVQGMPKWNPAKQSGRTVHARFNLPIPFER